MMTEEDRLMLELANTVARGDAVDIVMGTDADINPTDFDEMSNEELMLGMVDILLDGPNRKAAD